MSMLSDFQDMKARNAVWDKIQWITLRIINSVGGVVGYPRGVVRVATYTPPVEMLVVGVYINTSLTTSAAIGTNIGGWVGIDSGNNTNDIDRITNIWAGHVYHCPAGVAQISQSNSDYLGFNWPFMPSVSPSRGIATYATSEGVGASFLFGHARIGLVPKL